MSPGNSWKSTGNHIYAGLLDTLWFTICYRTIVCLCVLSDSDVGVFWPSGWIDQDETWQLGAMYKNLARV